jgi:ribosome recycling factor
MNQAIVSAEERMKKSVASLKDDFAAVRTGRASASLFDKLRVDYYGEKTPLAQVANISIPEARLIVVQPWDRSMIGEIEKAIRASELSLNPSNDGKVIRIAIPSLTEERRKELAKHAKAMAEERRVAIRNIRRDCNDELKTALKDGELTEDDEGRAAEDLQKLTDSYIKEINRLLEEKEKEIMEV